MAKKLLRWPVRDIKTQLFKLGNLNGKTYYFRFGVLFSYLQYFPLLKPKFFLLTFIFLKKFRFFQNSGFFFFNSDFFQNSEVFQNSGSFFKLRFFFRTEVFFLKYSVFFFKIQFKQCACHIPVDQDCWLKENDQNSDDDQNGFICFLFHFVPFTSNEQNTSVHSCDIREL